MFLLEFPIHPDNTPRGFAIRDHGDINKIRGFTETFSWFYRYHVFVKLLNVVTSTGHDLMPPPLAHLNRLAAGQHCQSEIYTTIYPAR